MTPSTIRRAGRLLMLATLTLAGGCKNFFPPLNGTTGTGTTNTGDYVYVASAVTSSSGSAAWTISGLSIGTGTLGALTGFPVTLPFPPVALAITPSNSLLYVAGSDVIYGYTISSAGALTSILTSAQSQVLETAAISSMVVSPDGNWLLGLSVNEQEAVIDEYAISSTGQLTLETGAQYPLSGSAPIVPSDIAIAPTGNYVAVALGTAGDVIFSFNTSTGALTEVAQEIPPTASSADQALTFDSTGSTLYVARSGTDSGVVPYVLSNGGATLTAAAGAPFALGTNATGPSSILIDATGKYLYVGDKTSSSISAFSIASGGVLTALGGSPYAAGTNVNALGEDSSGKYILATALGGSPDLQMYTIDTATPGKLDPATTASTGDPTEPAGAVALALTHPPN